MNLGSLTVNGSKFRLPCTYEFLLNGVVIYVGRSRHGFSRAFRGHSNRREDKRARAFNEADQIRVTVFDNISEARDDEIRLIQLHKPVNNIHFNPVLKEEVSLKRAKDDAAKADLLAQHKEKAKIEICAMVDKIMQNKA